MSRASAYAVFRNSDKFAGFALLDTADTPAERRKGLMGVRRLNPLCGMLFTSLEPSGSFWMKNCLMDLDVMFIDGDGTVSKVYTMKADDGEKRYPYAGEAKAIEMEAGFCRSHGIVPGTSVSVKEVRNV